MENAYRPEYSGPKINASKLARRFLAVMIGTGLGGAGLAQASEVTNAETPTGQATPETPVEQPQYVRLLPDVARVSLYKDLNGTAVYGAMTPGLGPLEVLARNPFNLNQVMVDFQGVGLWLDLSDGAEIYLVPEATDEGDQFSQAEVELQDQNVFIINNVDRQFDLFLTLQDQQLEGNQLQIDLPNGIRARFQGSTVEFFRKDESGAWIFVSQSLLNPNQTGGAESNLVFEVSETQTELSRNGSWVGFVHSSAAEGTVSISTPRGGKVTLTDVSVLSS